MSDEFELSDVSRRALDWYRSRQAAQYEPRALGSMPRLFEDETVLSLDACEQLRRRAWDAPYSKQSDLTFQPLLEGDCKSKAAWLQRFFGGAIMTGVRTDSLQGERHAVLLFVRQGKLLVADSDKIWPLDEHPFLIEGFVRAAWPDEEVRRPVRAAPTPPRTRT